MSDQRTTHETGDQPYRAVTDGDLTQPIPLETFLAGVGVVMRLPAKHDEKEPPPPPAPAAKPRAAKRTRSVIVAVSTTLSVLLGLVIALQRWDSRYSDVLPSTLIGRWHTDAPKFANRGFTVGSETLQMQRGPNPSDVVTLPIRSVRVRNAQRGRSVAISYEENGVVQTLALTLEDLDGMSIVEVHNQPEIVWRRK